MEGWALLRLYFFFVFPLFPPFFLVRNLPGCGFFWPFLLFFILVVGVLYYDQLGRSGTGNGYIEKPTVAA